MRPKRPWPTSEINNRAYTLIIHWPTNRQALGLTLCLALYLTTIITVAGTVLLPGRTAAMLAANSDLIIAALPAAYRHFAAPACSITTNSCCFHLQLNQHLTAFLQYRKHKERTANIGIYYVVTYAPTPVTYKWDNCRALRTKTRIHTNTPMNMTPLLALHYHLNDPIAGTVLLPNQIITATPTVQPTEWSRRYAYNPTTN